MINPYTTEQLKMRSAWAKRIRKKVKPDVYGVFTLQQGIMVDGVYVPGDKIIYEGVAARFICKLSKRVYGTYCYQKTRRRLAAAITIENLWGHQRNHLNVLIKKPEWLSYEYFCYVAAEEWRKLQWARSDTYIDKLDSNAIYYSLKEGSDSLVYINYEI